jgi:kynurenine formamidase
MKEEMIKNYIATIDFNRDWKLSTIKENLRKFLGEEPGVDIIYKKDVMLNEINGEAKEIEKINSVVIVYTDTDNKFKKLEFRIE